MDFLPGPMNFDPGRFKVNQHAYCLCQRLFIVLAASIAESLKQLSVISLSFLSVYLFVPSFFLTLVPYIFISNSKVV